VVDVADDRPLRDTVGFLEGAAAAEAGLLEETAVDPHAVTLGLSDGRPVPLGVVGDEHAADDPDAVVVGVATRGARLVPPLVEDDRPRPLGEQLGVVMDDHPARQGEAERSAPE